MSTMDIEQRCNALRQDLKVWEKNFAAQNEGRKAGREDIKANADISQKYKEYNKLRLRLSSKAAPRTPSKRTAARQPIQNAERTPRAQPNISASTRVGKRREDRPSEDSNQANEFLSPQGPNFIGPTPQRDGIVLGLFDMLPAETPSKKRVVLGDVELNVLQTPTSKPQEAESEASLESRARGERTPLSAGKRFLFNQFVTPKKRKLEEEHTPSSTMRGLSTPAFLRRDNALSVIDETNEPTPRPAPWKRRGLGRSLSDMIHAMRKDEDDRLDDEADIMRELEMEEEGIPIPKKPWNAEVLVEDSQIQMPLGPDRGLESEEDDEEEDSGLGPNRKPRKAWKKKGLKRQTRRVIMRPNFAKPKPIPTFEDQEKEEEEESVAESQQQPQATAAGIDVESDDDGSDYASDDSHNPKKRKTQPKKVEEPKNKAGTEGKAKSTERKIKATANANYRRLKIKAKGGNGGKGKFGRRR